MQCSITITTYNKQQIFVNKNIYKQHCLILKETAKKYCFKIWVFCFMPDHLHLLVEGKDKNSDIQKFIKIFKQKTGFLYKQSIGKKLWCTSYYDHLLRKEEDVISVVKYILNNPVRAGLVKEWYEYPFSGSFEMDIKELL